MSGKHSGQKTPVRTGIAPKQHKHSQQNSQNPQNSQKHKVRTANTQDDIIRYVSDDSKPSEKQSFSREKESKKSVEAQDSDISEEPELSVSDDSAESPKLKKNEKKEKKSKKEKKNKTSPSKGSPDNIKSTESKDLNEVPKEALKEAPKEVHKEVPKEVPAEIPVEMVKVQEMEEVPINPINPIVNSIQYIINDFDTLIGGIRMVYQNRLDTPSYSFDAFGEFPIKLADYINRLPENIKDEGIYAIQAFLNTLVNNRNDLGNVLYSLESRSQIKSIIDKIVNLKNDIIHAFQSNYEYPHKYMFNDPVYGIDIIEKVLSEITKDSDYDQYREIIMNDIRLSITNVWSQYDNTVPRQQLRISLILHNIQMLKDTSETLVSTNAKMMVHHPVVIHTSPEKPIASLGEFIDSAPLPKKIDGSPDLKENKK